MTGSPTTDELPAGRTRLPLLGIVLAIAVVWNVVGNLWLPGALYVPANLAVAAAVVWLAHNDGLSWERLGLARADVLRGVVIGLGAMAIIATVFAIGLAIPDVEGALEDDNVRVDSTSARWFVPLVRIPLGTAVFEEILFRSVILGALLTVPGIRSARAVWRPVAVTSILFGLWHVVPAWESADGTTLGTVGAVVGTVAITTIGGVVFAVLRLWSGSVVAPILAHTATNSFAYVSALIALELVE